MRVLRRTLSRSMISPLFRHVVQQHHAGIHNTAKLRHQMHEPHRTYFSDRDGQRLWHKSRSAFGDLLLVAVSFTLGGIVGYALVAWPIMNGTVREALFMERDSEFKRLGQALIARRKILIEKEMAEKERLAKKEAAEKSYACGLYAHKLVCVWRQMFVLARRRALITQNSAEKGVW